MKKIICLILLFNTVFILSAQERIKTCVLDIRRSDPDRVVVVSHRGDWRNAPENSLQAYANCIEMGVDMIEIDLKKTKDNQLVIMHDETIDRTTDGTGKVSDYTLAQLRKFHLKNGLGRITFHHIPTLEEVLLLAKDKILINIDKGYDYFADVYRLLKKTSTVNQVVIKSDYSYNKVKRENGDVLDKVIYMPIVNLDRPDAEEIIDGYKQLHPVAMECCFKEVTPQVLALLKKVRANGSKIWLNALWPSLNAGHDDDRAVELHQEDDSWGWLLDHGASIIQTDRPALLLKYLQEKGRRGCSAYQLLSMNRIENKAYYFTALLSQLANVRSMISSDSVLVRIGRVKLQRLLSAATSHERIEAMKFTDGEIDDVADALARLYRPGNPLDSMLKRYILPSGCYRQYKETDARLIKAMWNQDARGMNYAVDVYADARKPNYPQIDSIGFDVRSKRFTDELLPTCQQNIAFSVKSDPAFYAVPMTAVRMLLDMNDRCQSVDYEPLGVTCNKEAYALVPYAHWDKYPYSSILVLGAGPEEAGVAISPEGKLRAAYAAMLWRQGMAPFIIVSGGRVHPYHTPYNEACEMKKYLVDVCHIPASSVIMEPHARHTTTNFRNAARIMLRRGFPEDKKAIVTSSASHLNYVEHMSQRCLDELGYVPYRLGRRLTDRVMEFVPSLESTIINPSEPLDP